MHGHTEIENVKTTVLCENAVGANGGKIYILGQIAIGCLAGK